MIIATIGHQDYELVSIADAEMLLKIIDRSKAVASEYTAETGGYYRECALPSIIIEVSSKKVVTLEQHQAFKDAAIKNAAEKQVAA